MKKQVKYSLKCCMDQAENRKNSVELFGYDFCIDEDLGTWLIEVNASPDFSFSGDVTKDLVLQFSEDYVKVLENFMGKSRKKQKKADIGNFSIICQGKHEVGKNIEAMGMTLEIEGVKI